MNGIHALLKDRRRSQRGSILSGVLIIVMFLSIISGALMTELTTNFMLSRALVTRVSNEATVNSAIELAFDSIQTAPLTSACPTLTASANLNGRVAVATYIRCALVVDKASLPAVRQLRSSAPFNVDGTGVTLSGLLPGDDEYLVADSAGTLFAYQFGQTSGWSYQLVGTPTGPPVAVVGGSAEVSDLVPVSYANPTRYAVALLEENSPGQKPSFNCNMDANAAVIARPAASIRARRLTFFGDGSGTVFAYDATASGNCALRDSYVISGSQPVVAGPIVFRGTSSRTDDLFVVVSDGSSSKIVRLRYNSSARNLSRIASLTLPAADAVGMAADTSTVPARIAITYAGGRLSLVDIDASNNMSLRPEIGVIPGGGVTSSPGWCQKCLADGVIGVGGQSGLYLFDSSLNLYGSFAGAPIHTTPAADDGGDWFIAGDDGNLKEVQRPAGRPTMILAQAFPSATAPIGSSPVMKPCGTSLCIYFAAMDSGIYLVPLDARDAVLSACISNSPPTCSGDNPRLWALAEVGSASDPQAVRVQGWSYYSP